MNVVRRWLLAAALLAIAVHCNASGSEAECLQGEVEAHVRQQFAIYGPRSASQEYFGFIYLADGVIDSAVARSRPCAKAGKCVVDSSEAIRFVPPRAKVLGEWHTHPHEGSASLSRDDVRGANNNRHIKCYFAFYSTPAGVIHAWDVKQLSVPGAMASRVRIGSYSSDGTLLAARASKGAAARVL